MLGGGTVKQLYELKGEGRSIRGDSQRPWGYPETRCANTCGLPRFLEPKNRPPGDPSWTPTRSTYESGWRRVWRTVWCCFGNCGGGATPAAILYSKSTCILSETASAPGHQAVETEPGEQAQVDWGSFTYFTSEGKKKQVWAFVMVLSWSRAIYVETGTPSRRGHLPPVPRQRLCSPGRGTPPLPLRQCQGGGAGSGGGRPTPVEPRFLDFALRVGFDSRLLPSLPSPDQRPGGKAASSTCGTTSGPARVLPTWQT